MESNRMQITIRSIRKPKRFRSAFTTEQIKFLELQFKKFPYISSEHRKEIATALNMQERAVKIWFQNRRMKEKKESTNREVDCVTTTKVEESREERLNNAFPVSPGNDLSCSLPIIVKPVDTSTKFAKVNTGTIHREIRDKIKTQIVPENLSTNHITSSMNTVQDHAMYEVPFLHASLRQKGSMPRKQFKNKSQTINKKSSELSIDLSKKLKKAETNISFKVNVDHKQKLQRKFQQSSGFAKSKTSHGDLTYNKKAIAPQMPSRPPKQDTVNGPSYVPLMPTAYAHPYISSGGVIWKPINIMPIVAPGSAIRFPSSPQQSFGYDQKKNCNCNCHGNCQPFTMSTNSINPYAQYVMTTPASYQSSSPKI